MGLRSLPTLLIQTLDLVTSVRPRVLKVSNGTLVDNGDGSATLTTGGGGGSSFIGASVYLTSDQTIPAGGATTMGAWDAEHFDTSAIHDTATHNSRLTVPAGKTGYWRISGVIDLYGSGANATGARIVHVYVNGSDAQEVSREDIGDTETYRAFSFTWPLTAGDYVELAVNNFVADDVFLSSGANAAMFQMEYLGA